MCVCSCFQLKPSLGTSVAIILTQNEYVLIIATQHSYATTIATYYGYVATLRPKKMCLGFARPALLVQLWATTKNPGQLRTSKKAQLLATKKLRCKFAPSKNFGATQNSCFDRLKTFFFYPTFLTLTLPRLIFLFCLKSFKLRPWQLKIIKSQMQ